MKSLIDEPFNDDDEVPLHLEYIDELESAPADKYKITEVLATGRFCMIYGTCLSADTTHGTRFAMKTKKEEDKNCITDIERQEIHALKVLRYEDNVINLLDIIRGPGDLSMVMEVGVIDLAKIVRKKKHIEIDADERKTILYQFISGVAAIHKNGIIHRDIKPSNLLIMANGVLKVIDFGESTPHASALIEQTLSLNVGTTYYKPLEVFFGDEEYDERVDIWALGCSMAELYTRTIIFQGPNNSNDCQVSEIVHLCGFPDAEPWPDFTTLKLYPYYYQLFGNLTIDYTPDFASKITGDDEAAADLICKLLQKLPEDRISASDALTHNYFTEDSVAPDVKSLLDKLNDLESSSSD